MEKLVSNAHMDVDSPLVIESVPVVKFGEYLLKIQQCQDFWSHFELEGLTLDSIEFKEFLTEFKEDGKYSEDIWASHIEGMSYYFNLKSLVKLLEAERVGASLAQEDDVRVLSMVAEVPNREEIVRRKLEVK